MKSLSISFLCILSISLGCAKLDPASKKTHVGEHGGQLKKGKYFNLEMVPTPEGLKFYTYDKNNKLLDATRDVELDATFNDVKSKEEHSLRMDAEKDHLLGKMDEEHAQTNHMRVNADLNVDGKKEKFGFIVQ